MSLERCCCLSMKKPQNISKEYSVNSILLQNLNRSPTGRRPRWNHSIKM